MKDTPIANSPLELLHAEDIAKTDAKVKELLPDDAIVIVYCR